MFGQIETYQVAILILALGGAITDLLKSKIYNVWTIPFAIGGLLYSAYSGGWSGLGQSSLGCFAGLFLYGWMLAIRILGGGDVKLLMALGTWGGPRYTFDVAVLGVLLGGVFSILILIFTGKILDFIQRMYLFIATFQVQMPKVDKKLTMPMGIPIAVAAIWMAFRYQGKSIFLGVIW